MDPLSKSEISAYFASRLPALRQANTREWRCPCPIHGGKRDNFSVNSETGYSHCHSTCGHGWDVFGLEMELRSCAFADAKTSVYATIGRPEPRWEERDIEATFDYCDETGVLRYQVVRSHGKKFWQRRPDGMGGFTKGLTGLVPLPYRLPQWKDAAIVAVAEGEKDVHTLEALGFPATCNNGGAENFKPQLAPWFVGKDVLIFPDNDEKGRSHALKVAALLSPVAASIRIVELPCLPDKGDVTDWVRAGGTRSHLDLVIAKAAAWTIDWKFSDSVKSEASKYVRTLAQIIDECGGLDEFWSLSEQIGVPAPFAQITENLGGGMRPGEVYVIGGNQGSGKTSLALQFIQHVVERRIATLMFSMEMGWRDVFQRLISIRARVDLLQYRRWQKHDAGNLEYRDATCRLAESTSVLIDCPLIVNRRSNVSPVYIAEEIARMKSEQPIKLVVVDHMQLMASTGKERGDYEKFTAISRLLKATAVEIDIPILLVSQTSRTNEHDKRTELIVADLRGSGAIEEDAAGVMLLYPDFEDRKRQLEAGTYSRGPVKSWLKMGKSRYGQQDTYMPLLHFKTFTRFDPLYGRTEATA